MATKFDDLLTSEFDDIPLLTVKKRKKGIIGLDDLFNDHKKEQLNKKKGKLKTSKTRKCCVSDDEDDAVAAANETENKLTEALHDFKKTMCEVDGHDGALNDIGREDTTSSWGLQVFGTQRTPSPLVVPHLEGCLLLQSSVNNVLDELLDSSQMGATFLEGLLLNGWLSKLIITRGYLEESIAKWTINLLFYSSDESLMASASDFWCTIFCNKADAPVVKIEWLPGFVELNRALETFGFQLHSSTKVLSRVDSTLDTGSKQRGPSTNIRTWIKFADACFQVRSRYLVLSIREAEELIGILICLFLERQLLGLSGVLHDCLLSAVNFFEEKEWDSSCEKVAKSIADRIPRDLNCLRAVDSISVVDTRSKQLRSVVAFQFLTTCYAELTDAKGLLKFLLSSNLKDKSCNLFKIYLCLVLTENWLLFGNVSEPRVNELWSSLIRKCSIQISNTNFRPFAQEIRSRASYLQHSTIRD
ncbi:uncharacterized protein LOC110730894 isoform X1 [Chenopodium quinoa]|uniref:uncharacterized protein LOC110730894 isoform X1 n=1 Tax=Chenopodium quinoa TaxID=63459 RepID=UPI000B7746C0|nr:uncharacterized protein LOC110730894 isoform X1 [Chenopodium quinoa]